MSISKLFDPITSVTVPRAVAMEVIKSLVGNGVPFAARADASSATHTMISVDQDNLEFLRTARTIHTERLSRGDW